MSDRTGVLVALYKVLAIAAIGRATVQIAQDAGQAPVAYSLTASAGAVYLVGVLLLRRPRWHVVAAVVFAGELLAVVTVGSLTLLRPHALGDDTVWTDFGLAYGLLPLVLPAAAIRCLRRAPRQRQPEPGVENRTLSSPWLTEMPASDTTRGS